MFSSVVLAFSEAKPTMRQAHREDNREREQYDSILIKIQVGVEDPILFQNIMQIFISLCFLLLLMCLLI